MRRTLQILAAVLLLAAPAIAERYSFRHYGTDEGLNTAVSGLLQDRTGFLWVGSGDGLFRYDGARFQRFGNDDGLPSGSVRALHESFDGTLWVVTGGGLARLRQNAFEAVDTGTEKDFTDLHAIGSSPDGELYLGDDRGLLVGTPQPGGRAPSFHLVPGTPAEPVNGVYVEGNGTVWFGCGLNLCLLAGGQLRSFGPSDGLPPERWGAMLRNRHGDFFVRGIQHLYVLPAGAQKFMPPARGLAQSSNVILAMAEDRDGILM